MKRAIAILLALVTLASGVLLWSSSVQAACGAYWQLKKDGETVGACDFGVKDKEFENKEVN